MPSTVLGDEEGRVRNTKPSRAQTDNKYTIIQMLGRIIVLKKTKAGKEGQLRLRGREVASEQANSRAREFQAEGKENTLG